MTEGQLANIDVTRVLQMRMHEIEISKVAFPENTKPLVLLLPDHMVLESQQIPVDSGDPEADKGKFASTTVVRCNLCGQFMTCFMPLKTPKVLEDWVDGHRQEHQAIKPPQPMMFNKREWRMERYRMLREQFMELFGQLRDTDLTDALREIDSFMKWAVDNGVVTVEE